MYVIYMKCLFSRPSGSVGYSHDDQLYLI